MSNISPEEVENLALALEAERGTSDERRMYLRALLRVIETTLRDAAALVGRIGKAV